MSNTETEYIGSYAFQDCNSLKEIYLPKTIKEIGQYAFPKSVTDIYVPEEAELITFAEDNVLLANETAVRIHVKEGSWLIIILITGLIKIQSILRFMIKKEMKYEKKIIYLFKAGLNMEINRRMEILSCR